MTHTPLPPFAATSGPHDARVVFVGEAWGETEARMRRPFAGESGKEFFRMLGEAWPEEQPEAHRDARDAQRWGDAWLKPREAWLAAAGVLLTNVFAFRPPNNKLEFICGKKAEVGGADYKLPPIRAGQYIRPEFLEELDRLEQELAHAKPNLVVALGGVACWALLRSAAIGSIRGAIATSINGHKVLPTYHPAGVLRQWSWRPVVVADFIKAGRERQFPEVRRPQRGIIVDPSIDEVESWARAVLQHRPGMLSCDIETEGGQITKIGFSFSIREALVVPLWDRRQKGWSYWPSQAQEERAWAAIKALLESDIPKLFQNGVYDLQYLMRMGLQPRALAHDTMLLHHSIWPELQKGLGFLGSIYSNEASWKLMRKRSADTEKRDE